MKTKTNAQTHLNTTKYVPRIDKYYEKSTRTKKIPTKKNCKFQNTERTLIHTDPTANFEMIPQSEKVYNLVS